ncbi:MAG: hypothetical protein GEU90_09630 [Gemmatimonas sp.]|nr:hypothetical protein [Gemmatimonas sp.]
MKPTTNSLALLPLLALLALPVVGCGTEGETDAFRQAEAPTEEVAAEPECSLPDGLLERLNFHRQQVLNLAQTGGGNLEAVQGMGAPEPATFRSVADILEDLDLSSVASNSAFDAPDDIVRDLRQTADLLEVALAADSETADPAWTALAEFYTQEFFVRHNASLGYYLDEAGCV